MINQQKLSTMKAVKLKMNIGIWMINYIGIWMINYIAKMICLPKLSTMKMEKLKKKHGI